MKSGVRAIDFMSTNLITTTKENKIADIAKVMNKYRIGGVPVVNKKGAIIGLITERDIMIHVIAANKKPDQVSVGEVMTKKIITIGKFEDINDIAKKMNQHDLTRLPVLDEKKRLIGVVTNRDVLEQSPPLVDLILEQARIKGPLDSMNSPNALGRCEYCGANGTLLFKNDMFLCETCV